MERYGKEEIRKMKVHVEELEKNRKELENELTRFDIGRLIFAIFRRPLPGISMLL